MDKEVKARLRAVVHLEGISNKEIAEKIDYSELMVSKSLSLKYDVLTEKFLTKFFQAFPEVAAKHKEQILTGNNGLFNSGAELEVLRAENTMLKTQLEELKETMNYFKLLLNQAYKIYPDLQSKLVSPFAFNNELGVNSSLHGVLIHEGANKGAAGIAAA